MTSLKIFIIFLITLTASISSNAQQLWNGTTYGMTENAVKDLFPNIIATKSKPSKWDTAIPVYDLNGIDLEGDEFIATFFFKNKKLIKVRLYPKQIESTERIFYKADRIEEILTSKYGTPYISKGESLKYKTIHWKNKNTEILLSALKSTDNWSPEKQTDARNLAIIFDAEFVDAASKL